MDLLLRELIQEQDGSTRYSDTEISAAEVTLGSRPDQTIQILGAEIEPHHAIISGSAGNVRLTCRRGCRINHRGKASTKARLEEGDELEIGENRIRVIPAPAGFDLALEIQRASDIDASTFESAYRTRLNQTWLSRRLPSWLLLVLVLLLCLGVPLLLIEFPQQGSNRVATAIMPTDRLWSSGPLNPAHKVAIGDNCAACHTELFQRVADEQCVVCHEGIADHAGTEELMHQVKLDQFRCASCHQEHNEPPHITITADSLCTDCHREPQPSSSDELELAAVTGFDSQTHPPFKIQLLVPIRNERGTGAVFDWQPQRSTVADARERSNLKFPHAIHLNENRVRDTATDAGLTCGSCHQLSADKEHFVPITMEKDCRACHELTFDPSDPQRQLPHGAPEEVVLAMEGHYMLKYADPSAARKSSSRRRLPGRNSQEDVCQGSAFDCARKKTAQQVANQFTRSGCVTCHEVGSNESADLYTRYQVLPVRLSRDYYPWARFDHRSHLTQEGRTGSDACLSCHDADVSETSADVLIPGNDNCIECHGDSSSNRNLILHCIECHSFHPGEEPL